MEDKATSTAIFLEDAAPVGLLSSLLVASVAESSKYCILGTSVPCSQLQQGCNRIGRCGGGC